MTTVIEVPHHIDEYLPDLDVPLVPTEMLTVDLPQGDVWRRLATLYRPVSNAVTAAARRGDRPIVVSGDYTTALGTVVGRRCFIDHGAGVVIGETTVVGNDVMLYHGVTLGARGWWKDAKGAKRHPTVGDNVTLGVGCSIFGPVVIGDDSRIGAHALVVSDVAAGSVVLAPRGEVVPIGAFASGTDPLATPHEV